MYVYDVINSRVRFCARAGRVLVNGARPRAILALNSSDAGGAESLTHTNTHTCSQLHQSAPKRDREAEASERRLGTHTHTCQQNGHG